MRTARLSLLALVGSVFAAPVQVEERDNDLDERVYVYESKVVWTTTTAWSTKIVWETGLPDSGVEAAGFEGDEKPHTYSYPHHKVHTPISQAAPTIHAYTATPSTAAAPEPTSTSTSSTPPPPPPPSSTSSTSVYVAPKPTSTYVPPPAPTTSSVYVAPTTSSSVWVAPTTSAAPVASPASYSSGSSGSSSGSSSSGSSSGAQGTEGNPFSGEGTYYAVGMGSCGVQSTEGEAIVAVGAGYMTQFDGANPNNNPKCGQSITIKYKGVTKTAKIEDTCPGCRTKYDLDMSQSLFEEFASTDAGRLYDVEWWFN